MATALTTAELRTIVEVRATIDSIKSIIENTCTSLMGEPVSFTQVLAVVKVILGLALVPLFFQLSTCFIGLLGYILIYSGTKNLRR